ncbi:MAG TPA: glutathione S-transferase family protein [Pseudomonadota bacterium]|nr:glutathione S-transferase family protein [Pseudomonadota bacterium]
MMERLQVLGSPLSPYVRKVLVCLGEKGIPYELDPLVPFYGDERFSRLSPLRRIPVLRDAGVTLCDSSVICQYLEDRYPEPALYPKDIADRARARWLEEFADTRMGDVFIWRLFNQLVIRPAVWGEAPDTAVVQRTRDVELPAILDYLEAELPAQGGFYPELSIADISIACFFRNAAMVRFRVDAARWPRTAAFVDQVLARDSFARLAQVEARLLRAPVAEHRKTLAELGIPLTQDSYISATPRR